MQLRIKQLDSLRGIVALTVVISHFLNVFQEIPHEIKYGLRFMFASREAVIFFFLLSGFVLALPFLKPSKLRYSSYIKKRFFRIYIPYVVALTIAVLVNQYLSIGHINNLSAWFNNMWEGPIDIRLVLEHLLLIGSFNNSEYNPVLWSLVHEMRISLVFPLIMLLVIRCNWKILIMAGLFFSCASAAIHYYIVHYTVSDIDYFDTLHYVFMFIVGALLAKHRHYLSEKLSAFSKWKRTSLFLGACFSYIYFKVSWLVPDKDTFLKSIPNDWITTFCISVIIVFALTSSRFSMLLLNKFFVFMGEISYSVYLYHSIILLAFIHLLYGKLNIMVIMGLAIPVILVVSYLGWRFVELPSIKLSRMVRDEHVLAKKGLTELEL